LPDRETLAGRVKVDSRNWLWDGIAVVLDGDGPLSLRARHGREDEPQSAVLLHDGEREARTAPPGGGFHLASLARIGAHALRLAQ
jgi:hypothetical protein